MKYNVPMDDIDYRIRYSNSIYTHLLHNPNNQFGLHSQRNMLQTRCEFDCCVLMNFSSSNQTENKKKTKLQKFTFRFRSEKEKKQLFN